MLLFPAAQQYKKGTTTWIKCLPLKTCSQTYQISNWNRSNGLFIQAHVARDKLK